MTPAALPPRAHKDHTEQNDGEADSLAWLDDYQEGSTAEEVLDRVKRGMLLFPGDTPPDVIAAVLAARFPLPD